MKLIFVPKNLEPGDAFSPHEDDARHITKVLRLREGATLEGSDGSRRLRIRIVSAGKKVKAEVVSAEILKDDRRVKLAIARIDTARFASAFSAAAQMAVREVFAVGCARAARKSLDSARLMRVARESAKQVGCPFLPGLQELPDVHALAGKIGTQPTFLLDPAAPKTLLESFPYALGPEGILLIVGPVGDFTDPEKQILREAGALPAQLCGEILRSETAAVVALGVTATCIRTSGK